MVVCHCRGISDHEIRRLARQGARNRAAVSHACGASAGCGGCAPVIEAILAQERAAAEQAVAAPTVEIAAAAR
jgi:bacterioferritin-associated ferredoxin